MSFVSFRGVIVLVGRKIYYIKHANSGWIWNQPIPSISWSIGSFLEGCPLPPKKAVPEYPSSYLTTVIPPGFVRRSTNRIDARCYLMPVLLGQMELHLRLDSSLILHTFILWQTNMAMATKTVWRGKLFINNSSFFPCSDVEKWCDMEFEWRFHSSVCTSSDHIMCIVIPSKSKSWGYTHTQTLQTLLNHSESICNTYRKKWAIQGTWFSSLLCRDYKCHWRNHHIDPT